MPRPRPAAAGPAPVRAAAVAQRTRSRPRRRQPAPRRRARPRWPDRGRAQLRAGTARSRPPACPGDLLRRRASTLRRSSRKSRRSRPGPACRFARCPAPRSTSSPRPRHPRAWWPAPRRCPKPIWRSWPSTRNGVAAVSGRPRRRHRPAQPRRHHPHGRIGGGHRHRADPPPRRPRHPDGHQGGGRRDRAHPDRRGARAARRVAGTAKPRSVDRRARRRRATDRVRPPGGGRPALFGAGRRRVRIVPIGSPTM